MLFRRGIAVVLLASVVPVAGVRGAPPQPIADFPVVQSYHAELPLAVLPADLDSGSTDARAPIQPFQAWLNSWMRDTAEAARKVRDAVLPTEPQPGLQFNVDPNDEAVYLGWRTRF
jgi:hypothetical protein